MHNQFTTMPALEGSRGDRVRVIYFRGGRSSWWRRQRVRRLGRWGSSAVVAQLVTQVAAREAHLAWERRGSWLRKRRGLDGSAGSGGRRRFRRRRGGVRQEEELERWRAPRTRAAFKGVSPHFAADAGSYGAFGGFAHGLDKGIERRAKGFGDVGSRARRARGLRLPGCFAEEGWSGRRIHRRLDVRRIRRRRRSGGFLGRSRRENGVLQGRKGSSGSRAPGHTIASLLSSMRWHSGMVMQRSCSLEKSPRVVECSSSWWRKIGRGSLANLLHGQSSALKL